jgi:YedE family putative selenium metabolism protein
MLKSNLSRQRFVLALALILGVGALAAFLVEMGNPGNMGVCGACFLRDIGGSLGLFQGAGPRVFRPEILGLLLGPFLWLLLRGKYQARSGSHAATRFFFGMWMGIAALVVLGCPFRMLQRVGGGDLNALIAFAGFLPGVGVGLFFERRGYRVGRTDVVPGAVGMLGLAAFGLVFLLFMAGSLLGPGPGDSSPPAHAVWFVSLLVACVVGTVLSATRFCAISAARQVFGGDRKMLIAALMMILGYGLAALAFGNFKQSLEGQPIAHSDHLWSIAAMFLAGLSGCLAGGCPVRQVVMAGEGNGDAFCTVAGIAGGGMVSHGLGMASTGAGTTELGHIATIVGIVIAILYAWCARSQD